METHNKWIFLLFCSLCLHISAQEIQNPILPGVADAGIVKYNGKYYIGGVHTNGDFYISDDLVHWGKPVHVVSTFGLYAENTSALYNGMLYYHIGK